MNTARQSRNQNEFKRKGAKDGRRRENAKSLRAKSFEKAVQKNFARNAQFLEIALQRKAKSSRQDFTQSPQRRNEAPENLRSLRKLLCIVVRINTDFLTANVLQKKTKETKGTELRQK